MASCGMDELDNGYEIAVYSCGVSLLMRWSLVILRLYTFGAPRCSCSQLQANTKHLYSYAATGRNWTYHSRDSMDKKCKKSSHSDRLRNTHVAVHTLPSNCKKTPRRSISPSGVSCNPHLMTIAAILPSLCQIRKAKIKTQ
jgi:hypothetical protein